ncbi:hypothetical protein JQ633_05850 [Bradyrhizobium tropiciagri]|uniref:hypothetical protein n=1 Tax=Bradyrhizobium tropiciagri TaxID=312253 RepID=UPI001BADC89B|nr:hypothetical protein [Bradyrhizobium tropiciagri]MBR0869871.1 hypothetical protein [Bradyrhizobium tropiciagri]
MNRHDRRKAVKPPKVPATSKRRVMAFLTALHDAPHDADIEIRVGRSAGEAAILVSFERTGHALLVSEARLAARIMEETNAHSENQKVRTLPNIIMDLGAGCDAAERAYRKSAETSAVITDQTGRFILASTAAFVIALLAIEAALRIL